MLIDCHTHIGRNEKFQGVKQLLESMDKAKIDKSFVFASRLGDCSNEYLLEEIKPHRDRLYAVAASCPNINTDVIYRESNCSLLAQAGFRFRDWYQEGKIVAVKYYTGYDHYYPINVSYQLHMLNEVGCPAIFHSGDCLNSAKTAKLKYSHPLHIDEVAVDFPNMNFIIAHLGFPFHKDAAQVCYKNSNVYADISGFVYGSFTTADYLKFGKVYDEFKEICTDDKLLFGSDWPISDQSSYVEAAQFAGGSEAPQRFTNNIKKVFKL